VGDANREVGYSGDVRRISEILLELSLIAAWEIPILKLIIFCQVTMMQLLLIITTVARDIRHDRKRI
jgi:hypothetical protein